MGTQGKMGRNVHWSMALTAGMLVTLGVAGCGSGDDGAPAGSDSPSSGATAGTDRGDTLTAESSPSRWDEWLFTAHILVAYVGAEDADPSVTRSREDARRQALALRVLARKPGESFADVARRFSDDPHTRDLGGRMPPFRPEMGIPAYARAAEALTPGDISDPVETPLGYVIIKRLAPVLATARYVFIAFTGSNLAPEGLQRTREEARELAEHVRAMLAGGADFMTVAREYSDHGAPTFTREFAQGVVTGPLDRAIFALDVGALSDVVESEYGFHVLERLK